MQSAQHLIALPHNTLQFCVWLPSGNSWLASRWSDRCKHSMLHILNVLSHATRTNYQLPANYK